MAPIRVLVVDDSAEIREGLRAILEFAPDIQIVGEAADGSQAVALFRQFSPDVVLTDINMPVMDGLAAARQIKALRPATGIIVLSVYSTYLAEAMAAGASRFLFKDCPVDDILAAIREAAPRRTDQLRAASLT